MRQRWLLNLALLSLMLILGGLVFYTIEQDKTTESPKLTDIEVDKVENIRIVRANKEPIVLMKDALGFWQMTAPFKLPATHFKVDSLLRQLSETDYQLLEADNLNLADFQLEPPLASIKFDQLTMDFGNNSPLDYGQRYVRVNQKLYLLKDTVFYSLNNEALTFANRSLLGNNPKLTELKMPDYHLVFKDDKWTVTTTFSADEIDTSQDALNTLIDNWQNASAYDVEPYQPNSPTEGDIDITLLGQEQSLHLTIVSKTPDLVLARPEKGVQYKLSMTEVDKLLHLPTKSEEPPQSEE